MAALVRKSDISDLRSRLSERKSGTPDFRAIHAILAASKTWMAGIKPATTGEECAIQVDRIRRLTSAWHD
jgi:hypothetical protein